MGRVSKREIKILNQLVRDCIFYALNEHESLAYIEQRSGGLKISRSNLYNIKKRISKNEDAVLNGRLEEHTRIGYALNHINWIDDIDRMQKILFQSMHQESSKSAEKKNLFSMSRIATNILENIKFLRLLNIDTPLIQRMRAEMDKLRSNQRPPKIPDPIPTALTIPLDSIAGKPSEKPKDQEDDDTPVY